MTTTDACCGREVCCVMLVYDPSSLEPVSKCACPPLPRCDPFHARRMSCDNDPNIIVISTRILEDHEFNQQEVAKTFAKKIVDNYVKNTNREVSIDYIQKIVSEYFQMDVDTLQPVFCFGLMITV